MTQHSDEGTLFRSRKFTDWPTVKEALIAKEIGGVFILAFLILVIGGSLTLYAVRAPALRGGGLFAPTSREGALVFNNLILITITTGFRTNGSLLLELSTHPIW